MLEPPFHTECLRRDGGTPPEAWIRTRGGAHRSKQAKIGLPFDGRRKPTVEPGSAEGALPRRIRDDGAMRAARVRRLFDAAVERNEQAAEQAFGSPVEHGLTAELA